VARLAAAVWDGSPTVQSAFDESKGRFNEWLFSKKENEITVQLVREEAEPLWGPYSHETRTVFGFKQDPSNDFVKQVRVVVDGLRDDPQTEIEFGIKTSPTPAEETYVQINVPLKVPARTAELLLRKLIFSSALKFAGGFFGSIEEEKLAAIAKFFSTGLFTFSDGELQVRLTLADVEALAKSVGLGEVVTKGLSAANWVKDIISTYSQSKPKFKLRLKTTDTLLNSKHHFLHIVGQGAELTAKVRLCGEIVSLIRDAISPLKKKVIIFEELFDPWLSMFQGANVDLEFGSIDDLFTAELQDYATSLLTENVKRYHGKLMLKSLLNELFATNDNRKKIVTDAQFCEILEALDFDNFAL
jgi:hypothetical protein